MERLTAEERLQHSIPKGMTLLMTPENFDRIADFKADPIEEETVELIEVEFCIARWNGKKRYIKRTFRKQETVDRFIELVESVGGEIKTWDTVEVIRG